MNLDYRHLATLARAIHYPNLTTASHHVGLSQPQLSRVIQGLEQELGVALLDRSVRRQAHWTPAALQIAEAFERSEQHLKKDLVSLQEGFRPQEIHVACLDGLASMAIKALGSLQKKTHLREIHLDVLDLNDLEERMLRGLVDLAWTSRYPGRAKSALQLELGSQSLDLRGEESRGTRILSTYDYHRLKKSEQRSLKESSLFVSNSLMAREMWQDSHNGYGYFPSAIHTPAKNGEVSVLVIGQGSVAEWLWPEVLRYFGR